ncbi:MAG: sugar ABC transporter ATP-binding protein [Candidatus Atribacteria bacterium]
MSNEKILLKADDITKSFPGVKALDKVSLELREGEIHAVIGENGAGKSTLVNVLGGVLWPDSGQIFLNGREVNFLNSAEAIERGIGVISQELSDFPHLTVAENIFVNKLNERKFGFLDKKELFKQASLKLRAFEVQIDPATRVRNLSIGLRQILQIVRAILLGPRVLILDEPTTSLDIDETNALFKLLRNLNAKGVSLLYITHRLSELFGLVDRVTILRDGKVVGTKDIEEVSEEGLATLMVGRKIKDLYGIKNSSFKIGEKYFEIKNLTSKGLFKNVSFYLHHGEILGFFGLIGAGRTELFKAILGLYPIDSGKILYQGKVLRIKGVKNAIMSSLGYLPEDRKKEGLFLKMGVDENLIAPQTESFTNKIGIFDNSKISRFARRMQKSFNIITPTLKQSLLHLSGGNQQKVLLSMWVGIKPDILIVDEPTKGVDIGTKQMIYRKLRELNEGGIGIVVISSDLPEIIQLCDRIIIMHEGEITGELLQEKATEEKIMAYATGLVSVEKRERQKHEN